MHKYNELLAFKRLPDASIAHLLGLSLEEYHNLSHLPLEADTDINGEIMGFYMRISSNNNPRLLSKLHYDKNYTVKLNPEEVYKLCSRP